MAQSLDQDAAQRTQALENLKDAPDDTEIPEITFLNRQGDTMKIPFTNDAISYIGTQVYDRSEATTFTEQAAAAVYATARTADVLKMEYEYATVRGKPLKPERIAAMTTDQALIRTGGDLANACIARSIWVGYIPLTMMPNGPWMIDGIVPDVVGSVKSAIEVLEGEKMFTAVSISTRVTHISWKMLGGGSRIVAFKDITVTNQAGNKEIVSLMRGIITFKEPERNSFNRIGIILAGFSSCVEGNSHPGPVLDPDHNTAKDYFPLLPTGSKLKKQAKKTLMNCLKDWANLEVPFKNRFKDDVITIVVALGVGNFDTGDYGYAAAKVARQKAKKRKKKGRETDDEDEDEEEDEDSD